MVIEALDRFAIERACLDVLAIHTKYSGSGSQQSFADTELKAARFVLRLLHFESQLSPGDPFHLLITTPSYLTSSVAAEGAEGEDVNNISGVNRQLFASAISNPSSSGLEDGVENSLWGSPLASFSTGEPFLLYSTQCTAVRRLFNIAQGPSSPPRSQRCATPSCSRPH